MSDIHKTQVVIIGAGLSGLSAAKQLTEYGVDVTVLEARDRVGGRTYTTRNNIVEWVDLGGAYVGPGQNHILRLAKEMGIETYKVYSEGSSIQVSRRKIFTFKGQWPEFGFWSPLAWFDINYIMTKMEKMMEQISEDEPWNCIHAKEWDDMSVQTFVERYCWTRLGKESILSMIEANMAANTAHISLLWVLWYIKCCDGNRRIWNLDNGAQERKFVGGAMTVSVKLAELLGDKLHLNSQVCSLTQADTGVIVTTTDGMTYECTHVIMAVPLPMQLKLHYEPPLPALRNQLIQRTPGGVVLKANIYYKSPFWRQKGYNGFMCCGDGQNIVGLIIEDSRPGFPLAALTLFFYSGNVLKLQELSKETRLKIISQDVARAYGSEEGLYPVHYEEHNWSQEQYSGGCYGSTFPLGVLSQFGRVLREPFLRVHYAGTETATFWPGYMEGAVQAGERAAREILGVMGVVDKKKVWSQEPEFKEAPALPFKKMFLEKHAVSVGSILLSTGLATFISACGIGILAYRRLKV